MRNVFNIKFSFVRAQKQTELSNAMKIVHGMSPEDNIETFLRKTKCQSINKVSNAAAVYKFANEVKLGAQLPVLKDFFQNTSANSLEFDKISATQQQRKRILNTNPTNNPVRKVLDLCRKENIIKINKKLAIASSE